MGRASRRRRRDTYSRRRHELRERPDLAAPDWPPPEPDDRDDVARRQAEYDDLNPELPPPWWAQP